MSKAKDLIVSVHIFDKRGSLQRDPSLCSGEQKTDNSRPYI